MLGCESGGVEDQFLGELLAGAEVLDELVDVISDVRDDVGDGEELLEREGGLREVLEEKAWGLVAETRLRGEYLLRYI